MVIKEGDKELILGSYEFFSVSVQNFTLHTFTPPFYP